MSAQRNEKACQGLTKTQTVGMARLWGNCGPLGLPEVKCQPSSHISTSWPMFASQVRNAAVGGAHRPLLLPPK